MLDAAGLRRRARRHRTTSTARVDGADFVLVQIRVGGQAARLSDETVPLAVRLHRAGDDRRRRLREGAAHGAGRARDRRARARAARRRTRGSSTSRTRSASSRARCSTHGHRAIGLCNVAIGFQRWVARLLGVEPERVVVDQVGLNHLTWVRARARRRRATCSRELLAEHGDELAADVGLPRRAARRARRRSRPTTCATSTRTTRCSRAARRRAARRRRSPRSSASCSSSTATRARREAGAARAARRRVLQRGGDRPRRVARRRRRRRARCRRPQRRHARRARGRRRRRGARADRRDGAEPLAQPPLAPELLGLAQHVAAYERLAAAAALTRRPGRPRARRCSRTR